MNEERTLNNIFQKKFLWKNKYRVDWCDECDVAIIICPDCNNSSCSGSGCKKCEKDFQEFYEQVKYRIKDYLSPEELLAYYKACQLKKYILISLYDNQKEINWKNLKNQGELCETDEKVFSDFISV